MEPFDLMTLAFVRDGVTRERREPRLRPAVSMRVGLVFAAETLLVRMLVPVARSIRRGSGPLVRTTPFVTENRVDEVPVLRSAVFRAIGIRTVEILVPTN